MSSSQNLLNKKIVWEFHQILADPDPTDVFESINKYFDSDAVFNCSHPINEQQGTDAFIASFWRPLFESFPDLQRRDDIFIGSQYKNEDWVASTGYYVGTFIKDWLGIPPNYGPVNIRFGEFNRLVDGKIVESYILLDIIDVMRQAGFWLLPPSLGLEGLVPGPATHDGLVLTEQDEDESAESARIIEDMIVALNTPDHAWARYWHPKMMWYGPSGIGTTRGIKGFTEFHNDPFDKGFTDWKGGNHKARCGDGAYAGIVGWPSIYGTHTGNGWLGTTASGKKISMRVMDFWRREGHLLVENWIFIDLIDLFRQLGIDLFARMHEQRKVAISNNEHGKQ